MIWFGLFILGMFLTYLIAMFFGWDSFLNGKDGPPIVFFCIWWPVGLTILLIFLSFEKAKSFGEKLHELGEQRRKQAKEQVQWRIAEKERRAAEEKQLEEILQESEQEVEKYFKELKHKPR